MKIKMIATGLLFIGLTLSLGSFINKHEIIPYEETTNIEVSEGEELFKAKCSTCHIATKPDDMSKLIAPPIMGVMMHVKNGIEGKSETEKREDVIAFIVDYALNPSEEKSLLGPHVMERFKLMPSQKEKVTTEELKLIATYLYDNFPPKGMNHKKMHQDEKGCGSDCGGKCEH